MFKGKKLKAMAKRLGEQQRIANPIPGILQDDINNLYKEMGELRLILNALLKFLGYKAVQKIGSIDPFGDPGVEIISLKKEGEKYE